jgi:transglutaminase-like putative cysteine protease
VSALAALAALLIGAWGLVATDRVSVGVYAVFAVGVVLGSPVRMWLGGGRRATVLAQLLVAVMVLVASWSVIYPIPVLAGGSPESWRFVAHLMLVPTVMLTVDLSSRAAKGLTIFAGLVVLASAGSLPGHHALGPLLLLFTAVAVVAMALLDSDADTNLVALSEDPQGAARSRRTSLRRAAAVVLALALIVPVAAALRPSPPAAKPRSGNSGTSDSEPQRYAGYADHIDTADRFRLSNQIVMRVRADAPDFWRGTTYDTFDGRRWERADSRPQAEGVVTGPVEFEGSRPVGEPLHQTFTLETGGSDLIFGAYQVVAVDLPGTVVAQYDDGTLRRRGAFGDGAVYSVTSQRPVVTADALRTHDPRRSAFPPSFSDRYLQLPATVTERTRQLAQQLAAGQGSTYDVIRNMEAWLGANTQYTLDIPSLPDGADTVERYLFVDRKGFCEQIASSLVVMLRSLGVPARFTTGFVPGQQDQLGGEFVVRASDAHAWVEVYFPGVGWQAFDPTASVPLSGEFDRSFVGRLQRSVGALAWVMWVFVALAALGALIVTVRSARRRPRRAVPRAAQLLARLEAEGARRGRPRRANESPRVYCQALVDGPMPDHRLVEVGERLSAALYGGDAPPPTSAHWIEYVIDDAAATYRPPSRWRRARGDSEMADSGGHDHR